MVIVKKKQRLVFNFDKLYLKSLLILVPRFHNNLISFLTPLLGLYGINVREFIDDLNKRLFFLVSDTSIPIVVKLSKIKTYEIVFRTPYFSSILRHCFTNTKFEYNILSVYKALLLKSVKGNFFFNRRQEYLYLCFRGFLKSINRQVEAYTTNVSFFNKVSSLSCYYFNNYLVLSNKIVSLLSFKNLTNFSFFFSFPGLTNSKFAILRDFAELYNLRCLKIDTKLWLNFLGLVNNFMQGNIVAISSDFFASILQFWYDFDFSKSRPQFFLSCVKLFSNLLLPLFFMRYIREFEYYHKDSQFFILKILYSRFHFGRAMFLNNIKITRIIMKNANL